MFDNVLLIFDFVKCANSISISTVADNMCLDYFSLSGKIVW